MNGCPLAVAMSLGVSLLSAQGGGSADRDQLELARTQNALQQSRAEVERLLDLRIRHDLGLPADAADTVFQSATQATTEEIERLQAQLREEDAATAVLLDGYEKVRAAVERLRTEAAAITRRNGDVVTIDVPAAGTGASKEASGTATAAPAPAPVTTPASGLVAAPAVASDAATDLGPLRAQIHGSTDHLRVAQALFRAGQALMDRASRARDQDQIEAAHVFDGRAKERLERAVAELDPLLQQKLPPYDALFQLGRVRELLFRLDERYANLSLAASAREWQQREQQVREPFLAITVRDVQKTGRRGETEVLGGWGRAAQAAMVHFAWMNQHGAYDARASINAITWPGENER